MATLHKPMLALLWTLKLAAILFIGGLFFAIFWVSVEFDEPAHPFIILWTVVLPALTILLSLTLAEIFLFVRHRAHLTVSRFLWMQVIATLLWILDPLVAVLVFGSSRRHKLPWIQDPIWITQCLAGVCLSPLVISVVYAGTLYSTFKKESAAGFRDLEEEAGETDPLLERSR